MPPLQAVRYFESTAERESFTQAADDLSVSKGAIIQQTRHLEAYLGVQLFRKSGRRMVLTSLRLPRSRTLAGWCECSARILGYIVIGMGKQRSLNYLFRDSRNSRNACRVSSLR